MPAVLFEIQQHDTAMEKTTNKVIPALVIGKQIAPIEHDELIGIGPQQLHHFQAKYASP